MKLRRKLLSGTKCVIVITSAFLFFITLKNDQVYADVCSPNTCLGTNAYMKVNSCSYSVSGCVNGSVTYNVPVTCTGSNCNQWAPGLNGCNDNTPIMQPDGTYNCGNPNGGNISCCSTGGGGGGGGSSPSPTSGGGGGSCNGYDYITVQVRNASNSESLTSSSYSGANSNQCDRKLFQSLYSDSGCNFSWNCQAGGDYATLTTCNTNRSCTIHVDNIDGQFNGCNISGGAASGTSASFSGNDCTIASKDYANGSTLYINLTPPSPTPTPRAPECTDFIGPETVTKGVNQQYEVKARDPDDGTANGAGIGFVQLYWRTPGGTDWTQVSSDEYAQPYTFNLNTNNIPVSGTSRTIDVAANVYKTADCNPKNYSCTTGNSNSNEATWTESTACRKSVTINNVSASPTPAATYPTCDFNNSAPSSINMGSSANFSATSTNTGVAQLVYRYGTSGTWYPMGTAATGNNTNPTVTNGFECLSNDPNYNHNMSGKSYQVACRAWRNSDWTGNTCSGDPNATQSCSNDDLRTVTCSASASPTPDPVACSAPTVDNPNNNCSGSTKSVSLSWNSVSGCTQYEAQKATSQNFSSDLDTQTSNTTSTTFSGLTNSIPHYFRVRCSAKTNAASCSVPGQWSATKTSAACPGSPTATPQPQSRTCGETCNTTDQICDSGAGLVCRNGRCRNSSCNNASQDANCVCAGAPTPTPTAASFVCGQTRPANTSFYAGDDQPTSNINWQYAVPNTNRKCQYYCDAGYTWDGNSCEPDVQTRTCGQSCDGTTTVCDSNAGLTCRNSICRNSSCNNASQNAQCVCAGAPTNTPAPVACATPSGLNCGGSCNTSGDMVLSCTFTRDPRVSGFTVNYDDDSGFGSDSQNINTSVSGNTASVTYDATTTFSNVTHWFRIRNRTSDGSCVVGNNQYTNTVSTGPASCATYSCTNVRPANSTIHNGDEPPTGGNLNWRHSTTDNNRQCEFYCNAGYTYNSTANTCDTTSYSCGGTRPANTLFYSGDNSPSGPGVNWTYAAANTTAKCEYFCDTGYQWNTSTNSCELPLNACVAPVVTSGAITCTNDGTLTGSWNSVSGAATYRYQRNTSASTTGAVQANVSGTSLSVPIEDPSVTNYFRVRVQTVTNSAACTDPGAWSAWRSVNANTSCAAPTATPIVTSCVRPDLVTVTASCNPSPRIGASWDKVAGVLGYEYQIKLDSETWNNRADTTYREVTQPVGNATPPSFSGYVTLPNPPEYDVRVRSICSDGAGGEVTSPTWRSGTSDFASTTCAGPTSTPVPPPQYDVTVNLRVTDDNCASSTALTGNLNGRIRIDPPDPASIYFEPNPNDGSLNDGTTTITGLSGIYSIRPVWGEFGDGDDSPAFERATGCAAGVNPFTPDPISSDTTLNFYFTEKIEKPWWQSSFGDIYAVSIDSDLPSSSTYLSVGDGSSDAGAVVWKSSLSLNSFPSLNASEARYRGQETINTSQKYAYFNSMLNSSSVASVMQTNSGTYKVSGTSSVDVPWNISGNNKVTVIVPGDLNINANIDVDYGSFLFLIVGGNINIASSVTNVEGILLANGNIDIATARPSIDDQKIRFEGSVISFGNAGITSNRSLPSPRNSSEAATEFVYRPDIVINTPDNLRSKTTVWQEVAP